MEGLVEQRRDDPGLPCPSRLRIVPDAIMAVASYGALISRIFPSVFGLGETNGDAPGREPRFPNSIRRTNG